MANHVALAIDKAETFQTIEDLSRSLEDTIHIGSHIAAQVSN